MRPLRAIGSVLGFLVASVLALNIGAGAARRDWPALADRERWTPSMVERRSKPDAVALRERPTGGLYIQPPPVIWSVATHTLSNAIYSSQSFTNAYREHGR